MSSTLTGASGACRRREAVRLLGEHRVRTAIASGEFSSPWPGVLVDPSRAAQPHTLAAAGCLASGPDAILTGPTAAFLHGCTAAEPAPVHVVVPYGSRKRTRPGLVVHNGRALDLDRRIVAGLPVLCVPRVLADLLCTTAPPDALAIADQLLAELSPAAREGMRQEVYRRLRDRPDPRGTRIGARLLGLATGRAESPAESWLLWRLADLGFPVPVVNHVVCGLDGEPRYRVDLGWPAVRIAVEYHGHAAHSGREHADDVRVRELERRGWLVIVVRAADLGGMGRVERELDMAFRARGVHLAPRAAGAVRAARHRDRRAS